MDYRHFIEHLPERYENWGKESIYPKSPQFLQALSSMQGMTTANVMQLLNFAVECMESGEVYCEVGCYQGSTLVGALLNQKERMGYAVDNFSEFDTDNLNYNRLMANLEKFGMLEQVCFCDQDFEEFFCNLRELNAEDKIGVYLYDGAHDYRSQLMALLLVKPFLAEKALIIVDDSNLDHVKQANWDFIASHPECEMLLDLPTPKNGHPSFWNGLQLLSWDTSRSNGYAWETLQKNRQNLLIESIYNLLTLSA